MSYIEHNPTKKAKPSLKISLYMLFFSGLFAFVYFIIPPYIDKAKEDANNDLILKPEMQRLAEQGKPPAIVWLASHYADPKYLAQLDTLVEKRNPDALILKARLIYNSNKELAMKYIHDAANEGNEDAIMILSKHKNDDYYIGKFLKDYLFNPAR